SLISASQKVGGDPFAQSKSSTRGSRSSSKGIVLRMVGTGVCPKKNRSQSLRGSLSVRGQLFSGLPAPGGPSGAGRHGRPSAGPHRRGPGWSCPPPYGPVAPQPPGKACHRGRPPAEEVLPDSPLPPFPWHNHV